MNVCLWLRENERNRKSYNCTQNWLHTEFVRKWNLAEGKSGGGVCTGCRVSHVLIFERPPRVEMQFRIGILVNCIRSRWRASFNDREGVANAQHAGVPANTGRLEVKHHEEVAVEWQVNGSREAYFDGSRRGMAAVAVCLCVFVPNVLVESSEALAVDSNPIGTAVNCRRGGKSWVMKTGWLNETHQSSVEAHTPLRWLRCCSKPLGDGTWRPSRWCHRLAPALRQNHRRKSRIGDREHRKIFRHRWWWV